MGMSMEFVNRICPNCKNPNYMVSLGDFSKAYIYKCINCNRYFNDIDFEEQFQPVWKTEYLNKKVDMVEVVRCKDCKYRFVDGDNVRFNMCLLNHNKVQPDDWFCADGESR